MLDGMMNIDEYRLGYSSSRNTTSEWHLLPVADTGTERRRLVELFL